MFLLYRENQTWNFAHARRTFVWNWAGLFWLEEESYRIPCLVKIVCFVTMFTCTGTSQFIWILIWLPWTILIAALKPLWICPRCTTPCTPTTSSIPSQWFGLVKFSSFSGPHAFAPEPQLLVHCVHLYPKSLESLPHNVENNDALYGRQLYVLSVHFQLNFFV